MSVLQSGRCKGAGHTLALTLIWLHKGEKTAEQAGRQASMESYPPKKAHRVKICQTKSMLPSQRGLPVVHKGEESCPCAVGAPICCGGQGCCTRLPVCMLYFFGTPLSLQHSGNPDVLIQCRNASANPFLPPWQREFLNHTDAHGLVGAVLWCQSGVTLRSWSWLSSESIPGCQVFVSQRGKASFQLVSFNHEV